MLQRVEKRKVTIVDIARAAGVSRAAVSLVLRAKPGVGAEARARVVTAMRELGYVYNRGAANLRQSRSSVVGMIINDLTNPFFAQLAVGIERALSISGYMPFIANYFKSRKNSGFVEGLNNKIKVIKRRCYGLSKITTVFQRLFLDLQGYEIYA